MSYPNIPLGRTEQERRVSSAVNYLLNQSPNLVIFVQDQPTAAQSIYGPTFLPISYTIIQRNCYARASVAATSAAVFTILIAGVTAGTITFNAGATDGVIAFSITSLPALTNIEIVAPNPQDATLSDITLILALDQ